MEVTTSRECDVCVLVDGDHTPKAVHYCSTCDAFICDTCTPNLARRGYAMVKRRLLRPGAMDRLRQRTVEEGYSFLHTPYEKNGRRKGPAGGVDCATFLFLTYMNAGLIDATEGKIFEDPDIVPIGQDWFANIPEEKYLRAMLKYTKRVVDGMSYPTLEAKPGNIVLTRTNNSPRFNHAGLVVKWPKILHAVADGGVQEANASEHPMFGYRDVAILDPFVKIEGK